MKESGLSEIELKDTSLQAFKYLLRYIYTGQMTLGNLKDELILEILGLAHQYGFMVSNYLIATSLVLFFFSTSQKFTSHFPGNNRRIKKYFSLFLPGLGESHFRLPSCHSECPQCLLYLRHRIPLPTGSTS